MADYYPVLKRAVETLAEPSGEARRDVYERARAALALQLAGYTPPLSDSEISEQQHALEASIRKVEAEAAVSALRRPSGGMAGRGTGLRLASSNDPEIGGDARRDLQPRPSGDPGGGDKLRGAVAAAAGVPDLRPPARPQEAGATVLSGPGRPASAEGPAPRPLAPAKRPSRRAQRHAALETARRGSRLAPSPPGAAVRATTARKLSSRLPALAAVSVFMLVVGGLAGFTWINRDRLASMFDANAAPDSASGAQAASLVEEPPLPPKGDERLMREEASVAALPALPTNEAAPAAPAVPTETPTGDRLPMPRPADPPIAPIPPPRPAGF